MKLEVEVFSLARRSKTRNEAAGIACHCQQLHNSTGIVVVCEALQAHFPRPESEDLDMYGYGIVHSFLGGFRDS